ncbi:cytochrome-450 hydroxylase [Gloeopeniophorella convolvens]|nr:cytochrome-450 hydroxylase [Gloeopeniophorella convolvens]
MFTWIQSHPILASLCVLAILYNVYERLHPDPIMKLPSPRGGRFFGGHILDILDPGRSPTLHERYTRELGRNVRLRGVHPWEQRLLPMDPVTVAHIMKNSTIYEKPWQSRRLIEGLIGCGMLAAEGQVHKRQRRVATPAFSIQNMRALVPLVFSKGEELKDRWMELIQEHGAHGSDKQLKGMRLDICHWVSRATFDVIGLAGFDYQFNAIQNEDNELFNAYKDMFEMAISQSQSFRTLVAVYAPLYERLFPDKGTLAVRSGQETIGRVARKLIQERKQKIQEGEESGKAYGGRDLLSLLLKSNASTDIPPEQRISDDDILHNINTFMFAGSDTTSLAVTWTLLLLAKFPSIQDRLREELRHMGRPGNLGDEAVLAHYQELAVQPLLDKVCRESLRLVPPVHSSLRVATQDDVLPVSKNGNPVHIRKGTFVHVPVEAMNLDKEIWGKDAWQFIPDRWDNLPEAVTSLPGLYANTLTFSAGPRSCIGQRFSLIEMKTFLYILITNFVFSETDEKVVKANVVLTRPYLSRKFEEGSQCPMIVTPYVADEAM